MKFGGIKKLNPDKITNSVYTVALLVMYALYILAYFNLYRIKSKYLDMLSLAVNLFVCVVLMVKFNPFIKVAFTANDTRFIFACSTVLFSNILATNYLVKPYYMKYVEVSNTVIKEAEKKVAAEDDTHKLNTSAKTNTLPSMEI
jgi:hypothetical protein